MVTDDDRREVARRLRHSWTNVPDKNPVRHQLRVLFEIYSAVGLADDDGADAIDLFARLADLIDPSDMSQGCRDTVACDREALLALAEVMQAHADGAASADGYPYVNAGELWSYADRIREACGEVVE